MIARNIRQYTTLQGRPVVGFCCSKNILNALVIIFNAGHK